MRCLVSDTGPLLHLTEALMLHVLQLAGDLHVPPFVVVELARHLPAQQIPEWITVDSLTPLYDAEASAWQQAGLLDAGEAEAIALARQIEADWLLTDDAAARLLATESGDLAVKESRYPCVQHPIDHYKIREIRVNSWQRIALPPNRLLWYDKGNIYIVLN